jgi:uncharacterized protein YuzE
MKIKNKDVSVSYDFGNDILYVRKKNQKYSFSKSVNELIIDYDNKNNVIGFEILNASDFLYLKKINLQNIKKIELELLLFKDVILIKAIVGSLIRNNLKSNSVNIEKPKPIEIPNSKLKMKVSID